MKDSACGGQRTSNFRFEFGCAAHGLNVRLAQMFIIFLDMCVILKLNDKKTLNDLIVI